MIVLVLFRDDSRIGDSTDIKRSVVYEVLQGKSVPSARFFKKSFVTRHTRRRKQCIKEIGIGSFKRYRKRKLVNRPDGKLVGRQLSRIYLFGVFNTKQCVGIRRLGFRLKRTT